jgi:hypothetical protein
VGGIATAAVVASDIADTKRVSDLNDSAYAGGAVASVTGDVAGKVLGGGISTITATGVQASLADDAITSAKFDESTAYPLKAADTGATQIARVGADSDTLETLSDQVDTVIAKTNLIGATTVTISAPVATAGTGIAILRGDDYLNTDGRALSFIGTNWPSITSGSLTLRIGTHQSASYSGVITASNAGYVELTRTLTNALPTGDYNYELDGYTSGSSRITLVSGVVAIRNGLS